jgi:hypothetical protein
MPLELMYRILTEALEKNTGKQVRCARCERLMLNDKFYPYVINGSGSHSKDFYQHHFTMIRLNGPGDCMIGALYKDDNFYIGWKDVYSTPTTHYTQTLSSQEFKNDFSIKN